MDHLHSPEPETRTGFWVSAIHLRGYFTRVSGNSVVSTSCTPHLDTKLARAVRARNVVSFPCPGCLMLPSLEHWRRHNRRLSSGHHYVPIP